MVGWTDGETDRRIDGWKDGWTNVKTTKLMTSQRIRMIDGQTDRRTD